MKKITYSFFALLTTIVLFSSCNKKEVEVVKPAPTVNFIIGQGMVSGTTTLTPGNKFKVGITVGAAGDNLASFSVDRNGAAVSEFNGGKLTKNISGSTYSETLEITAASITGTYTYNFTAATADNKKTTLSLTIIVTNQIGEAILRDNYITLGAQTNPNVGGFFATSTQKIYMIEDAKTNASMIDFVYIINKEQSLFYSPSTLTAKDVYKSIDSWTVINETAFQNTTLTVAEFDNITGDAEILLAYGKVAGLAEDNTGPLTVGKVVGFKTKFNKTGLLKITNIVSGINGTITFDVKVQK